MKTTPFSPDGVDVTIKYVDENNNYLKAPFSDFSKAIGISYVYTAPEIEGYEPVNKTIEITPTADGENVYTITYKAKVEETTAPVEAETNAVAADDEKSNPIFFVIMILIIAGIAVGAFLLMKSNKKNEEKAKNQNKAKNRKQK